MNDYIYISIILLIIAALIYMSSEKKEGFEDVEKPNILGRNIIQLDTPTVAKPCNVGEIQIGEYCKNVSNDEYRKICGENEKYSDGYCIKTCPDNAEPTGNPSYCLSKCPDGYIANGSTCLKYTHLKLT